jgi:hypothetical protein
VCHAVGREPAADQGTAATAATSTTAVIVSGLWPGTSASNSADEVPPLNAAWRIAAPDDLPGGAGRGPTAVGRLPVSRRPRR